MKEKPTTFLGCLKQIGMSTSVLNFYFITPKMYTFSFFLVDDNILQMTWNLYIFWLIISLGF